MDDIHIPNDATYAPFSLTDIVATAPVASRLILGATLPGRVLSAAALGIYTASAAKDWVKRLDMRWIDFQREFGVDVRTLESMPAEARRDEISSLASRLDRDFTSERIPRARLAKEVNRELTDYIAGLTGQRVHTSSELRDFTLAKLVFPFAMTFWGPASPFRLIGRVTPRMVSPPRIRYSLGPVLLKERLTNLISAV